MKKLLMVLGIASIFLLPTIANSATGYVEPSADTATKEIGGVEPSGTDHYLALADGLWSDTTPDIFDYVYGYFQATAGLSDVYDMTTVDMDGGTASNITVWGYGHVAAGGGFFWKTLVTLDGTPTTLTDFEMTTSDSWKSTSFDGSWSQADLDGMTLQITLVTPSGPATSRMRATYAVVTYSAGGGNGGSTQAYSTNKKGKKLIFVK